MEVISTTAKVIILRLNATPKTEGIYEFQGRDKDSILNPPKYSASDSFNYAELNKTKVIDKAIGIVKQDFGILSFQIKTIIIDLLSNSAEN